MALSPYPHLFDELDGAFTRTTQLYTQRVAGHATPKNYRFTIEEMLLWMIAEFGLVDTGDIYHLHVQASASTLGRLTTTSTGQLVRPVSRTHLETT